LSEGRYSANCPIREEKRNRQREALNAVRADDEVHAKRTLDQLRRWDSIKMGELGDKEEEKARQLDRLRWIKGDAFGNKTKTKKKKGDIRKSRVRLEGRLTVRANGPSIGVHA